MSKVGFWISHPRDVRRSHSTFQVFLFTNKIVLLTHNISSTSTWQLCVFSTKSNLNPSYF